MVKPRLSVGGDNPRARYQEVFVVGDHQCDNLPHKRMTICLCSSPYISNSFDQNNLVYIWIHCFATKFSFLITMSLVFFWFVFTVFYFISLIGEFLSSSWILYFKSIIKTIPFKLEYRDLCLLLPSDCSLFLLTLYLSLCSWFSSRNLGVKHSILILLLAIFKFLKEFIYLRK